MSRVYFHSPSGTAELNGSERAWLGSLCNDLALGVLDLQHDAEKIAGLVDQQELSPLPGVYDFEGRARWRSHLRLALTVGMREVLSWHGHTLSSFSLILNTACATGSDAVKLAARLHAQCELHAWVDGPNRAWLADIMQSGLDAGVFRKGFPFQDGPGGPERWSSQGWDKVMELLRSRDDEPVVTSYSVTDRFPNRHVAEWSPPPMPDGWHPDWAAGDGTNEWEAMTADAQEEYYDEVAGDEWYELPEEDKWAMAMPRLRASRDGLELKSDNWQSFRFRHELTMFDLLAHDRDARFAAVFEPAEEMADG